MKQIRKVLSCVFALAIMMFCFCALSTPAAAAQENIQISFDSKGGSAVAAQSASVGATYGELPVPAKTFYTFDGWYLDANYSVEVTADTIVTAGSSHTLHAKWSILKSDDDTIIVSDKGNNTFGLAMDGSFKQIRFQFKLHSGAFSLTYTDDDGVLYNNPIVTIVDIAGNPVSQSKVQVGQWYTAIIYGGSVLGNGVVQDGAGMAKSATLHMGSGQVEMKYLETLTGQYGIRILGRNEETWKMTDASCMVDGKIVNGYNYNMNAANLWDTRMGMSLLPDRYTKMTMDFCVYEHATAQIGEKFNMTFSTQGIVPLVYDMDGIRVRTVDMKVGTWYRLVFDISGLTGEKYIHPFGAQTIAPEEQYKAYITNVSFVCPPKMIDDLSPATSVTVEQAGTNGTFLTTPVTRDTHRGTYYVSANSAHWSNRVIRVTRNNTDKELIQIDFRFITSKDSAGKDITPTLKVSTTLVGTIQEAQYVILDRNDMPVTALETGKWYRMFIYANGVNTFGLVPATTGEIELQLEGLDTFNTDELPLAMASGNLSAGSISAVLTRFGKMQYAYAGTAENTLTLTLNKNTYKHIRFSFQMKQKAASLSISGANLTIMDASGAVVTSNLKTDTWYTAEVMNNGQVIPSTITANVSGATALVIKDLAAYETLEVPADKAASTIFRGLDADEMMLSSFIGPREEGYYAYWASDQRTNPKASLARDEIFKLIAEAGINYITDQSVDYAGASKESAQHVLRLAAKYGIHYFAAASDAVSIGVEKGKNLILEDDPFYSKNYPEQYRIVYENTINEDLIKAKLREMYQYESFGGLYLRDEPRADLFEPILQANTIIQETVKEMGAGTVLNQYVNMFPDMGASYLSNYKTYTSPANGSGGYTKLSSWDEYLRAGVLDTGMNYVGFDMYPFDNSGLASTFLNYLGRINKVATDAGVPWIGCAQVGGGLPSYDSGKKVVNRSELHWDVNAMLAFGAKGIIYYIGVSPPYFVGPAHSGEDPHSLIDTDGNTTQYYDYVKEINTQIKAIDHVLMNSTHVGVLVNSGGVISYNESTGKTNLLSTYSEKRNVKINSVTGKALIGAFNYGGKTALLVVNNTTDDGGVADTISLRFTSSQYTLEVIQDAQTSWATGQTLNLSLLPGRCALVVVHDNTQYTVTFQNDDGTVIDQKTYRAGDPVSVPANPTKAADNTYTYTFAGWDNVVESYCGGNTTYTATYTKSFIDYTVIFKNEDDTVISENTYHYGDPIVVPDAPAKVADNTYTYTFAGWGNEVSATCVGNTTYTAVFSATPIDYTVIFQDEDGRVISEETYHWGDTIVVPTDPTKAADNTYTYAFAGWDTEVVACAGNATYKATYMPAYIEYIVIFKNEDGTVIDEKTYHWGETIVKPANPTKAADHTYTYAFAGWDSQVGATCAGSATYTATYTANYIDYTIIFKDDDGKVISEETYHWGSAIVKPADPIKAANHTYTYAFAGWDREVSETCAGSVTYTATYTSTYIDYTIIFKREDGTVISEETYHWGEAIEAPQAPAKAANNIYTYTFAGWGGDVTTCAGNATYTATYTANYIDYIVTFMNDNGTVHSKQTYHWGDRIVEPENPTKMADNIYAYTFNGWDRKVATTCAGNATYTASYKATYVDYTVTFKNDNGTVISEKTYHWGDTVETPSTPTKVSDNVYTYTFAGWDKEVVPCAGNTTYKATYTPTYIDYTVIFKNEDGTVISEKTYHWGETIVVPADPTKEGNSSNAYIFAGWDKEVVPCAGNAIYTATYNSTNGKYTVVFKHEDGTVISLKTYHWGDRVELPANPTKQADNTYTYTFIGWDTNVATTCSGNATYTAKFFAAYINYEVSFRNWNGEVLANATYHWGEEVVPPANPTRNADNMYTYRFTGWDKEVVPCAGSAVYTAIYEQAYVEYTVTFRYRDGTIIQQKTYHYGEIVIVPENPDGQTDGAEFIGWNKDVHRICTENVTYVAIFTGEESVIAGDTNGDGELRDDDAIYLLYHTFLPDRYPVSCPCDFDRDGEITSHDAVYLLYHIFVPDQYPLN